VALLVDLVDQLVGDADIARWSQRLEFFADALVDVEVVEQIAEVVEGNALPRG